MKKYIIEEENLRKLLESLAELWALECAGVDNWSLYRKALDDKPHIPEDLSVFYREVEE